MKINVHIERLVLDGLPVERRDGPAIQHAVEAELTRLLGTNGLSHEFRSSVMAPRVQGEPLRIASQSRPTDLGQGIADAVHGVIGHKERLNPGPR